MKALLLVLILAGCAPEPRRDCPHPSVSPLTRVVRREHGAWRCQLQQT